jgi:hypothetical protein
MKQIVGIAVGIAALFAIAACGQGGTTVSGSSTKRVDISTISQIGCALAQVAGGTAGAIAADIAGVDDATKNAIAAARQITTDACAALNKIAPVIDASAASVSATVTPAH